MWWRCRFADLLWNVDHLPRNSFYHQAMATDEELALKMLEEMPADDDQPFDPRPAVAEFGLAEDLMTMLVNEVRALKATVASIASGSNAKVDFLKGPKYAIEAMRHEARAKQHRDLAARLVPHRYRSETTSQE